jgi:hypothetical protein
MKITFFEAIMPMVGGRRRNPFRVNVKLLCKAGAASPKRPVHTAQNSFTVQVLFRSQRQRQKKLPLLLAVCTIVGELLACMYVMTIAISKARQKIKYQS